MVEGEILRLRRSGELHDVATHRIEAIRLGLVGASWSDMVPPFLFIGATPHRPLWIK